MRVTEFLKSEHASEFKKTWSGSKKIWQPLISHQGDAVTPQTTYTATKGHVIAGIANDYLLRVRLGLITGIKVQPDDTSAHSGYLIALGHLGESHPWVKDAKQTLAHFEHIQTTFFEMKARNTPLTKLDLTTLIMIILKMAKMDSLCHTAWDSSYHLTTISTRGFEEYVIDLIHLWKTQKILEFLSPIHQAEYGVPLGSFGDIITKADPDLIINGNIIDIKTTIKMSDPSYLLQCLTYWIIYGQKIHNANFRSEAGVLSYLKEPHSNKLIGLYYGRFNTLKSLKLAELPIGLVLDLINQFNTATLYSKE